MASTQLAAPVQPVDEFVAARDRTRAGSVLAYCRRNPQLVAGLAIVGLLLGIGLVGPLFVDVREAQPTSVMIDQPPSQEYPLGSDDQGRNLLAAMVVGIPLTLRVGFVAGSFGLGIGVVLGLLAGYRGGWIDAVIRMVVDTLMTVPALLVLIMIAASIKGFISVWIMGLIIASLAWMNPTRIVRSQVLTLRERAYVQVARLSGMSDLEIIVRELLPNMLPYLAAAFVGAVSSAVLASIGLEVLGLGPQNDPTLGMTIYWANNFNAILRGMWWWWGPPILVVVLLFVGLFLTSAGLDEIANPRKRKQA
ncbi:MAG TPA: ABC transporter permease [Chloroflexota bacterium]|nr:ABC transporter permease [Chloroflexota bacterium]